MITWMDVGGAQDHVLSLVSGLDPGRFEVAVATGTSKGALGRLFDPLADAVQVVPLQHLRREISPLHDLLAVREIRQLIKAFQPDILHTHSSKAGVVGRLAAAGTRVKTVHNVHGWTFYATENPLLRRAVIALERRFAAHTDVMLNVSAADAAVGQANGITPRVSTEVVRRRNRHQQVQGSTSPQPWPTAIERSAHRHGGPARTPEGPRDCCRGDGTGGAKPSEREVLLGR